MVATKEPDGIDRVPRSAAAVSAILMLAFLGALAALGAALYSRSLSDARGMAVALEHYALRTIVTGDLLTRIARDKVLQRGTLDQIAQDEGIKDVLAALTRELPEGSGMIVVDPTGRMVASNAALPDRQVDLSDRAWFRAHQDGADMILSEALLSRVTNRIMFIVTRAVRDGDGRLLAIINFGVPSDSLVGSDALPQFYDGVVLTLMNREGALLARSAFPPDLVGTKLWVPEGDDWVGPVANRAIDARAAVEATETNDTYGLVAQASIPMTQIFAPLLLVAAVGLPIVGAVAIGIGLLLRTLARSHRELKATKARLEAVIEASHLGSWHLDVSRERSDMNARWAQIVGHRSEEIQNSPQEWLSRLHPDERPAVLAEMQALLSGEKPLLHIEHRLRHKDGHWVWVLDSGCVVEWDEAGRPLTVTGTILDISERREAENRARVLMRELDHRAKNLLAVVYSMINLMKADSVAAFKTAILGRVKALGHVHSLLSGAGWQGVPLDQLIRTETAAYLGDGGPKVIAGGPTLILSPAAAQAVAIVVHEWMTNSAKYGALSSASGVVRLDWRQETAAGPVEIVWQESGGPEVEAPVRSGFGTTLLTLMVKDQLNGTLSAHWPATGAVFEVAFPADHLRAAA